MIKHFLKISSGVFALMIAFSTHAQTNHKTTKHLPKSDEKRLSAKIDSLVSLMTLEEKVSMIKSASAFTNGGVPRLGIPEIVMSDGPHGVRHEVNRDWSRNEKVDSRATFLPAEIALASTWNKDLAYKYGTVLGTEAKHRGKDIILGPGINIVRSPLNGRNFEYMSEDPYLISVMGVGYVKGVQDQGISACVKHYLANNQETKRQEVDVLMDERALREIYLPGFKAAVQKGNAYTIMGAYNKFRGQYCTHNEYLINKVLKGEMGFKGAVISDWSAVQNTMQALKFGTDIEMGTEMRNWGNWNFNKVFMGDTAISLVKAGVVDVSYIDAKVKRILWVMHKINMFGKRTPGAINTPEHQKVALNVAEEGIVLLKNNNILPLKKDALKSIAVIGDNAVRLQAEGGGSAQVLAYYEITPLKGLRNVYAPDTQKVSFSQGYVVKKDGTADPQLIAEAVKAASEAEVAIVIGGFVHGYTNEWNDKAFDSEGADKKDIKLPFGQDELIKAVVKANPNTIVVLLGGSASDMSQWVNDVKAIAQVWYPGMEGGNALANILFGKTNPSGKLPVTFPKQLSDMPSHSIGEFPGDSTVNYKEGIFVGYRHFDTHHIEPLFPFGHGLSYTQFAFSNLHVQKQGENVLVSLSLKNTGKVDGAEVVQVYVSDEQASVERPKQELKAFEKVFLKAGESKNISLTLGKEAFQFFDDKKLDWVLEAGKFTINVGSSSKEIKLKGAVSF